MNLRTAMDHSSANFLNSRTVGGRTISFHPNPNEATRTTYQHLWISVSITFAFLLTLGLLSSLLDL